MKRLVEIDELEHVADILRHEIGREILDRLTRDALLDLGGVDAEDFTEFYDGLALQRPADNERRYQRASPVLNTLEDAAYRVLKACRNAAHGLDAHEIEQDEIERLIGDVRELVLRRNSTIADRAVEKIKHDGPLVKHGRAMNGRRKGKSLPSSRAIDGALKALGRDASAKMVLKHLEATGVCRTDGDCIVWTDGKTTKENGFPNRVSERRKRCD